MSPTLWVVVVVVALVLLRLTLFVVPQQSVFIVERLGKFRRAARAGLGAKIPFIDRIAGKLNLRVQLLDVEVETKTEDNVFLRMLVAVQYRVREDKVFEAFYRLQDLLKQITSFVFDVVRSKVPSMKLDAVYESQDDIARTINDRLVGVMSEYGYEIMQTLVTDINPDEKVKAAMNEINTQLRLRIAAQERGEADKILQVKAAEAEKASKVLQGEGIAGQRTAIINGLRESVESFRDAVAGATAQDVMTLVMMTQYFDTLSSIGARDKSSVILLPHSPGALSEFGRQIRDATLTGELMAAKAGDYSMSSLSAGATGSSYGGSRISPRKPPTWRIMAIHSFSSMIASSLQRYFSHPLGGAEG